MMLDSWIVIEQGFLYVPLFFHGKLLLHVERVRVGRDQKALAEDV